MIAKLRTIMSMIFMDAQIEFKEHCRISSHPFLLVPTYIYITDFKCSSFSLPMPRRDKDSEHQKSVHQTYYCLGSSNVPTGFSSFPGNMDGLLSSCSISHLEHIIPTASYNASISIAGRIVL